MLIVYILAVTVIKVLMEFIIKSVMEAIAIVFIVIIGGFVAIFRSILTGRPVQVPTITSAVKQRRFRRDD